MFAFLIMLIILSGGILVALVIFVARSALRDKRVEDARQRQRESDNAEMWRRVQERVDEATRGK